jgi:hypothetical protein
VDKQRHIRSEVSRGAFTSRSSSALFIVAKKLRLLTLCSFSSFLRILTSSQKASALYHKASISSFSPRELMASIKLISSFLLQVKGDSVVATIHLQLSFEALPQERLGRLVINSPCDGSRNPETGALL